MKALVVEDSKVAQEVKCRKLSFATGLTDDEILRAGTLAEAIRLANQNEICLVSLDLLLTDSRGIDTLRGFLAATRVLPGYVYVVTADAHDIELREECEALQVAGVVPPGLEPWGALGRLTERQKEEIREILSTELEQRDHRITAVIAEMTKKIVEEQQRIADERRMTTLYRLVTVSVMAFIAWLASTVAGPYLAQILRAGLSAKS